MKKEESKYLRFLTNFWTLVTFATIILDAMHGNELETAIGPVLAIYAAILALYSAEKEFERWRYYFMGRHPGEVYVIAWTFLLVGLFTWSYVTHSEYEMPHEAIATYIVVIGILAITKKSKDFFLKTKESKSK